MTGLFVKDFYLLKEMKRFVVLVAIMLIVLYVGSDNASAAASAIFGYLMVMLSLMSIVTISYDEMNNGMPFLMSLPVSRKKYVMEKYAMGILMTIAGWCYCLVLISVISIVTGNSVHLNRDFLFQCLIFMEIGFFMLSLSIPVQFQFGGEKGRIVCIVIMMALFFGGTMILRWLKEIDASMVKEKMLLFGKWLEQGTGILCIFPVVVLIMGISFLISYRIMRRKEF